MLPLMSQACCGTKAASPASWQLPDSMRNSPSRADSRLLAPQPLVPVTTTSDPGAMSSVRLRSTTVSAAAAACLQVNCTEDGARRRLSAASIDAVN